MHNLSVLYIAYFSAYMFQINYFIIILILFIIIIINTYIYFIYLFYIHIIFIYNVNIIYNIINYYIIMLILYNVRLNLCRIFISEYKERINQTRKWSISSYFTGCLVNGQKVTADRSVTTTEDPCVTCRCNNNKLICAKLACPILSCPTTRIVHDPGKCCPRCRGERNYIISIIRDEI